MRTCGWVGNATPPVIPGGGEGLHAPLVEPQHSSSLVAPELTVKVAPITALTGSAPVVAWVQVTNVATPATAALESPPVHENVPVFWLMTSPIVRVSDVTVLPP